MGNKANIITVSMGYGHQRTAYPLANLALDGIISANDYPGIPEKDKKIWESSRKIYESISRFKRVPLIGQMVFRTFDKFQQIPTFYPKRDLSKPTFSLRKIYSLIEKGWGRDLIEKLKKNPCPLITTFFTPAFMAEVHNYPGDIFCVICDADVARTWAPLNPQTSKIKYFAPNTWVRDRLKLYGLKKDSIILTGYPLPIENIGTEKLEFLKTDLSNRILNLDPEGKYRQQYKFLVKKHLGKLPQKSDHVLTILFSIGGAGAQKELAMKIVKRLAGKISRGELKIILSAGIRPKVKEYFLESLENLGLKSNENVEVLFDKKITNYFEKFNQALRKTDILWTKPSELSFYAGLGLPILIAPSIGAQEDLNKKWLLRIGAGIVQEKPEHANEWLFDYLDSGRFAEAAIQGFIEIEKMGARNIEFAMANSMLRASTEHSTP